MWLGGSAGTPRPTLERRADETTGRRDRASWAFGERGAISCRPVSLSSRRPSLFRFDIVGRFGHHNGPLRACGKGRPAGCRKACRKAGTNRSQPVDSRRGCRQPGRTEPPNTSQPTRCRHRNRSDSSHLTESSTDLRLPTATSLSYTKQRLFQKRNVNKP